MDDEKQQDHTEGHNHLGARPQPARGKAPPARVPLHHDRYPLSHGPHDKGRTCNSPGSEQPSVQEPYSSTVWCMRPDTPADHIAEAERLLRTAAQYPDDREPLLLRAAAHLELAA